MTTEFLTFDEVSKYLRLGKQKLYHFVQQGKIPAYKFGRAWRFRRKRLEEWIEEQDVSRKKKSR